ncbi:MAG: holo-ACP synthase [Proteobacteria bacterium]|nr:holo-ACP synthase [Pseudomonadota bacterium]
MIVGIGNDVCDIRRIALVSGRKGERFARKVLGPDEWRVYDYRRGRSAERGLAFLATRFSAKESFSKAIGLGLKVPMRLRDCEILNEPSGKPFIRLHGELAAWFESQGWRAHVTVSDETDYAMTVVVVEHLP